VTFRVLVVEDMQVLYDLMLQTFEKSFSMEKFEFTNVKSIPAALDALEQDWDAILMDYYLGVPFGERQGLSFEHGADLITYRRTLEKDDPQKKKAYIIGISGSELRNQEMVAAGAAAHFLKLDDTGLTGALAALEKC